MVGSLSVSKDRLQDFLIIAQIEEEKFQALLEELSNKDLNFVDPIVTKKLFIDATDEQSGHILLTQAIGLSTYIRDSGKTYKEALGGLQNGIKKHKDWLENNSDAWKVAFERLSVLVEHPSLNLAAKSLDLNNSYENIINTVSLLTDVRPIFNDERDDMVGATITSTLLVEYLSNYRVKKEGFVIDYSDLLKLQKEIEKALKKVKATKVKMSHILDRRVIIHGENN